MPPGVFFCAMLVRMWMEYAAIERFYGDGRAKRSGVRFMKHIDDGIFLLEQLRATDRAMRAFCLHPIVQADDALAAAYERLEDLTEDPKVLVLVLEYRKVANAYLSTRTVAALDEIALSPLAEVNDMLRADKLQNYFDFLTHHRATHPRADALDAYFHTWLHRLAVDDAQRANLFERLAARD